MKKILIFTMTLLFLLNSIAFSEGMDLKLVGEGAILMDYHSKKVFYEENAYEKMYPASTTKLMTAILAVEHGNLKDLVKIDSEIISLTRGSHIALDYDEEVVFEDLLNALLVASGNDAALAIAKHVGGGSIDTFIEMMNHKAKELGALNTNFSNPHGLHDENHYTTAYDLALIAAYAMEDDLIREIAAKTTYTIGPTNKKNEPRVLLSTNRFLQGNDTVNINGQILPAKYDYFIAGKTGYTHEAGRCLVSLAEKDGRKLIAVVLKSDIPNVYGDTIQLFDYGFNNYQLVAIARANEFIQNIEIENGIYPIATGIIGEDFLYPLSTYNIPNVDRIISTYTDLVAPINRGDVIGSVEFFMGDESLGSIEIVSATDIASIPVLTRLQLILDKWYLFVFGFLFLGRCSFLLREKRKKTRKKRRKLYDYNSL